MLTLLALLAVVLALLTLLVLLALLALLVGSHTVLLGVCRCGRDSLLGADHDTLTSDTSARTLKNSS